LPGTVSKRGSITLESVVLDVALEQTDLSSRQLAAWITDNKGFSVSESSVYRLLKRQGLIKSPDMKMAAGKVFHAKTTRPHQMWATDASYFRVSGWRVCGWGFYYLVTVMDAFSRFILAWRLQRDMTSDSFIEVVQGSRPHRHDRRSMGSSHKATFGQRARLYLSFLRRIPAAGGHPSHPGFALPSSDQRQTGTVPSNLTSTRSLIMFQGIWKSQSQSS